MVRQIMATFYANSMHACKHTHGVSILVNSSITAAQQYKKISFIYSLRQNLDLYVINAGCVHSVTTVS